MEIRDSEKDGNREMGRTGEWRRSEKDYAEKEKDYANKGKGLHGKGEGLRE